MGGRGRGAENAIYFPGTGERFAGPPGGGDVPPGAFRWFASSTARYGGGGGRVPMSSLPQEWLGNPRYANFLSWLTNEGIVEPESGQPPVEIASFAPPPGPGVGAPPEPVVPSEGDFFPAPPAPPSAPAPGGTDAEGNPFLGSPGNVPSPGGGGYVAPDPLNPFSGYAPTPPPGEDGEVGEYFPEDFLDEDEQRPSAGGRPVPR